jgi:hypothetical protein
MEMTALAGCLLVTPEGVMVSLMVSPVVRHEDETSAVCWSITGRNRASHAHHVASRMPLTVGHCELATVKLDESSVVCLNDPRNLQGADLIFTDRLIVRPSNCAAHPRTGERPVSSTHQCAHLVTHGSKLNRPLVVQFEGEEQFELVRAWLNVPLYRLHDHCLAFHACVFVCSVRSRLERR